MSSSSSAVEHSDENENDHAESSGDEDQLAEREQLEQQAQVNKNENRSSASSNNSSSNAEDSHSSSGDEGHNEVEPEQANLAETGQDDGQGEAVQQKDTSVAANDQSSDNDEQELDRTHGQKDTVEQPSPASDSSENEDNNRGEQRQNQSRESDADEGIDTEINNEDVNATRLSKKLTVSSSDENSAAEGEKADQLSDDGGQPNDATTAKQLFGDDDLSSSDDNEEKKNAENAEGNVVADEEEIVGPRLYPEIDDEDEEPQAPPETVIEVEAPRISVNLDESGAYFVKYPNFLSVESRPFDPEHYEDEIDEDEQLDEEGRSRLKLRVENTVRWRYAQDEMGNEIKQSNAKIVRWSDGSMSLYLGSEIFEIHPQPVQDHNHLFIRQGAGLQGQSVFKTKLTFRPHSTDTMTHRKMTLNMADRSSKAQKVKVLADVGADPETQKQDLIKREEERLRATIRRESQQRRVKERMAGRQALSAGFLEPDRDYDSGDESISAIKKSYKPGGRSYDRLRTDRTDASQNRRQSSDNEREDVPNEDRSDNEMEIGVKKPTKRKIVLDDEDDENEEIG